MKQQTVGFIGAGNMARSLAGGLLANGWDAGRLLMADPDAGQRETVQQSMGLAAGADNRGVAARADVLVLAVKPQILKDVARELAPVIQEHRPLVISIAAGVRSIDLERWLGGGVPVVRVMPNTAALVGSGASGLYASPEVSTAQRNAAESIMRSVGVTVWVPDEGLMDTVTALSGSGPAYFLLLMEALEAAAVDHGLDRGTARLLTLETALGAAKIALEGGEEPAQLRQRVTSPGGTTAAALKALEGAGFRSIIATAVGDAIRRSRELGDLLGEEK